MAGNPLPQLCAGPLHVCNTHCTQKPAHPPLSLGSAPEVAAGHPERGSSPQTIVQRVHHSRVHQATPKRPAMGSGNLNPSNTTVESGGCVIIRPLGGKTCEAGGTLKPTTPDGCGILLERSKAIHSLREITNVFPKQERNERTAVVEWAYTTANTTCQSANTAGHSWTHTHTHPGQRHLQL